MSMQKYAKTTFWLGSLVSAVAFLAVFFLYQFSVPVFLRASYEIDGKATQFAMPLQITQITETVPIDLEVYMPPMHPTVFRVTPDDCLESVIVNGYTLQGEEYSFCDLMGRDLYLGEYLQPGKNDIRFIVKDYGGLTSFRINVATTDILFVLLRIFLFFIPVLYGIFVLRLLNVRQNVYVLFAIVVALAFFMKFYDGQMFYKENSYDAEGHVHYINYVRKNWSIPSAQGHGAEGWEYYQPPSYYFLGAGWMKLGSVIGRTAELQMEDMETMAWVIMTIAIAFTAWIATMVFPTKRKWKYQYYLVAAVGLLPAAFFLCSRITNDGLFHLITLIFTAFMVRWWQKGREFDWYACTFLVALGILTKSNAIPLIGVVGACLLLKKEIPFKKKVVKGITFFVILIMLTGWYNILRFYIEGETFIVGNRGGLAGGLIVENKVKYYLTFNPFKVFDIPFNNVWSDAHRRQYFLEYFYRSAFSGEFDFGYELKSLVTLLLMIFLPILCMAVVGTLADMKKGWNSMVPLWALLGLYLAAAFAYRIKAPYSANQDFRFISPIILPIMYYALYCISLLPKRYRSVGFNVIAAYCILSTLFIILIVL